MYRVLHNGRLAFRTKFTTYDKARSAVRKFLRDQGVKWEYSNPPLSAYGFSIKLT